MSNIYRFLGCSLFFFLLTPLLASAQRYPLGLNPSRMKWEQINTDKVQVIFPEGLDAHAQRVTNMLHYLHSNNLNSIGDIKGKITIILQNQTVVHNGFVALSPFRSEFYMTPPQFNFLGTGNWLDLLAIHEYRHVQQTYNAKRGITKLGTHVCGQNCLALMRRVALPRWYLEGDAVASETVLTTSGRGRLPEFDMEYRSVRLSGKHYGYEKASATSFKDFVPDFYRQGYYMTTYARRHHGEEVWKNVLARSVTYRSFFPLSHSLKKYTGLTTPKLYRATVQELDQLWKADAAALTVMEGKLLNEKPKRKFTNYQNMHFLDDRHLIAEKDAFNQISTVYLVDEDGNESPLFKTGITTSMKRPLSVQNGKIVWEETQFHPRWGNKNYTVVKIAELEANQSSKTGEKVWKTQARVRQLTHQSKYFSPALSRDASEVVVAEVTEQLAYSLVILDASTGAIVQKIPNPENLFYSFPNFTDNGGLVAVAQKDHDQALVLIDRQSGEMELLTPYSNNQITNPQQNGEYVYFSGAHTGINNIFAVHLPTKNLFQVTSSRFGAFQPSISPDGSKLVYADFTANGFDMREMELQPASLVPRSSNIPNSMTYFQPLVEQEGGSILGKIGQETWPVVPFRKSMGIINPHSIQPFVMHPNYSAEIQSLNKFTTLSASVGYNFNVNENTGGLYGRLIFAEFFPVMEAGFDLYAKRQRLSPYLNQFISQTDTAIFRSFYVNEWKEQNVSLGLNVPLNFTRGTHFTSLRLIGRYNFLQVAYEQPGDLRFGQALTLRSGQLSTANFEARFFRLQNRALQHVQSRWGQVANVQYQRTFMSERNQGQVFRASGELFFPGLSKNHGFSVSGAFQQESLLNTYQFRDNFFYPRGYNSIPHDQFSRVSVNYAMPLWYPDIPLGPFAFIQRIRANFFYDHGMMAINQMDARAIPNNTIFPNIQGFFPESNEVYRSAGAEIIFDFRFMRLVNLSLGARYSYLLDTNKFATFGLNPHRIDFIVLSLGI